MLYPNIRCNVDGQITVNAEHVGAQQVQLELCLQHQLTTALVKQF